MRRQLKPAIALCVQNVTLRHWSTADILASLYPDLVSSNVSLLPTPSITNTGYGDIRTSSNHDLASLPSFLRSPLARTTPLKRNTISSTTMATYPFASTVLEAVVVMPVDNSYVSFDLLALCFN